MTTLKCSLYETDVLDQSCADVFQLSERSDHTLFGCSVCLHHKQPVKNRRDTAEDQKEVCTRTAGALLTSVQEIYLRLPRLISRWACANELCARETLSLVCLVIPGTTECSGAAQRAAGRASTCCRGCRFTWGLTTARSPSSARRRTVERSSPPPETWRITGAYTQVGSRRYPPIKAQTRWKQ